MCRLPREKKETTNLARVLGWDEHASEKSKAHARALGGLGYNDVVGGTLPILFRPSPFGCFAVS